MKTISVHTKANVLGVGVDAVNMEQALAHLQDQLRLRHKGYVCFTGVHGVMEALRDPNLANIFAHASLTAPDGMPTVWVGRHQGHSHMDHVTGPDLMLEIFKRPEFSGYTHYLCGGKEGVAQELRNQLLSIYPCAKIIGTFTPPFGPMTPAGEREFIATVNQLRPDIIWVGISTPAQERFMERYLPLLDTTVMFGVGAAFDFHTGRIADCDEWIKRAGFQWLHRLLQDPRRLWRRYLRNNSSFLWHIFLQLTGLRTYPPQPRTDLGSAQQPAWSKPQSLG